MPVIVKAVPGTPYGNEPRVRLRIESGYRAGSYVVFPSAGEHPVHWMSRNAAEAWARDTGYTVAPADPALEPASVKLLVSLFETFNDFQFEHRCIGGAELVESLGEWLRQHAPLISQLLAGERDAAALKLDDLLCTFHALQSTSEEVSGGDLVDQFGAWLAAAAAEMPDITGAPFVGKVARSSNGLYWSSRQGWGDLEDATAYFRTVPDRLASCEPGTWTEVELVAEEFGQAERWVATDTIRG